MKKIVIPILFVLLLISCKEREEIEMCSNFQLEDANLTDDLEYEIINTIIDSIYSNVKCMHILQQTDSSIWDIKRRLENKNVEIASLMLQDYKDKNNKSYLLSDKFSQKNIKLISNDELRCIFSDTDAFASWRNYYKKYNNSFGYCRFNRPGFNTNKNKAIIEYGWRAGADVGEGYVVVLEKLNDRWVIVHYFPTWISK